MRPIRKKALVWFWLMGLGMGLFSVLPMTAYGQTVTYNIVTNEIHAKEMNGGQINVYRFDPAVFPVQQGDDVVLSIRGVKGRLHDLALETYGMRVQVEQNKIATIRLHADKAGIFRLICTTHADARHEGPMEGYLVVIPRHNRTL